MDKEQDQVKKNKESEIQKLPKNVRSSADLNETAAAEDARDDSSIEQFGTKSLLLAYKEMEYLQAENEGLYSSNIALKRKLVNLETEILTQRDQFLNSESIQELKQKYECTKQVLAAKIKSQENEIGKREEVVQNMLKEKNQMEEHLHQLEAQLKEEEWLSTQQQYNNIASEQINAKLEETTRQNEELKKTLEANKRIIEERYESEKSSLQKIMEALSITTEAVAEKEKAERCEEIIKEECHNLSSTIGCVMNETAKNIQGDSEALRKHFEEKERALLEAQNKLKADLQKQVKITEALQNRGLRYEKKCKNREKEKNYLTSQLQSATKALHEMQETLKAQDILLKDYTLLKKRAEQNEKEIEHCMKANVEQEKKHQCSLDDIKEQFQRQVDYLKNENDNLKADKLFLKEEYDKDPDCPK